jgi:cyclic-di-AMP phosphodiesterase PgpH
MSKFRYPGPVPYSKETAVLMMSDAVEAASRSLKKYDEESIQILIDKIIDKQIAEEQFVNAPITFRDITRVKKILKKKLMSIYHVRVAYPN